jgi:hypothetical protein
MTQDEILQRILTSAYSGPVSYVGTEEGWAFDQAAKAVTDIINQAEHDRDQALERMRIAEGQMQSFKAENEIKTKALWDIFDCTGGIECTGMEAPEDVWGIAFEALGEPKKDRWEDAAA